jgi:hypothetical protein
LKGLKEGKKVRKDRRTGREGAAKEGRHSFSSGILEGTRIRMSDGFQEIISTNRIVPQMDELQITVTKGPPPFLSSLSLIRMDVSVSDTKVVPISVLPGGEISTRPPVNVHEGAAYSFSVFCGEGYGNRGQLPCSTHTPTPGEGGIQEVILDKPLAKSKPAFTKIACVPTCSITPSSIELAGLHAVRKPTFHPKTLFACLAALTLCVALLPLLATGSTNFGAARKKCHDRTARMRAARYMDIESPEYDSDWNEDNIDDASIFALLPAHTFNCISTFVSLFGIWVAVLQSPLLRCGAGPGPHMYDLRLETLVCAFEHVSLDCFFSLTNARTVFPNPRV